MAGLVRLRGGFGQSAQAAVHAALAECPRLFIALPACCARPADQLAQAMAIYGSCSQHRPSAEVYVLLPGPDGDPGLLTVYPSPEPDDRPIQPRPDWQAGFESAMARTGWGSALSGQHGTGCVGGTWDQLHLGHKLLLTAAAALSRRLIVGVTDPAMLTDKPCGDLVEPLELRAQTVREFLKAVSPSTQLQVLPITDPIGPAALPEVDLLVVSQETFDGIRMVNQARAERAVRPLAGMSIPLVPKSLNPQLSSGGKLSSSALRESWLGTFRPAGAWWLRETRPAATSPERIYCVGLTGGIASGKSSVAAMMAKEYGIAQIDADKVGHRTYRKGSRCNQRLSDEFGPEIVQPDGQIDRRKLGGIVFGDPKARERLQQIVWPEIEREVATELESLRAAGHRVCVLEAAVLLEAGWDSLVDECWVVFAPRRMVVERVVERDSKSQQAAEAVLAAQMSNRERIGRADLLISTHGTVKERDVQVDRAVAGLRRRVDALTPAKL